MKLSTPLLLASLATNVALVAVVYNRSAFSPTSSNHLVSAPASNAGSKETDALRAAFASGDLAALQAAGFSAETAREIMLGRAFARFAERLRTTKGSSIGDDRWWKNRTAPGSREQELRARRELSEAMLAVFGDDFGLGGGDTGQLSFLSPEKRAALRRITQDYDEMTAKFSANGIQLASDREKLQLLRAERQRDIAALLTPTELAEYEMRTSSSAAAVKARFGNAITSEDDFKKLYALQKAFDDKYPMPNGRVNLESMSERVDAQRQLHADMRAALGKDAYTAMARAADPDLQTVDSLVSRLNLPASTTERITAEREAYAADSQRIAKDTSLTPEQRRAQLQELGTRAKAGLTASLGTEAGQAYSQRAPWINMLQSGLAFSTNPEDGPMGGMPGMMSVVPVMPEGAAGPGTRQMVNIGIADPAGGPGGGGVFFSAGAAAGPAEPGRVMTFDTIAVSPELRTAPAPNSTTTAPGGAPMQGAPAPAPNSPVQSAPVPRG